MTELRFFNDVFKNYKFLKSKISMLEVSLNNFSFSNEEISNLSLAHPVGSVDYGKCSVRTPSQKTANIALFGENKLSGEKKLVIERINALRKIVYQVDIYVNKGISNFDRDIWKDKYINGNSIYTIAEKHGVAESTISRRLKKIGRGFANICALTNDEVKKIKEEMEMLK